MARYTIPEMDNKEMLLALRDEIVESPLEIALHRAQVFTRVWQEHEQAPRQIKKALALREYFNTVPLFLRKGDAVAGNICEIPGGHPLYPEIGIAENGIFVGENREYLGYLRGKVPREIHEYWLDRNLWGRYRAWMKEVEGVDTAWTEVGQYKFISLQGHLSPSLSEILRIGVGGVLAKIQNRKEGETHPAKREFLTGAELTILGLSEWIGRYAALLREESEKDSGGDSERRQEIECMAADCARLVSEPPETFRQAMQLAWFAYQAVHVDGHGYSCTPDRIDQLLYPYLERDLEAGKIDESTAYRLCANFILKQKDNTFWGPLHNMTQGLVVSGSDPSGRDQTNTLSWLFIAASGVVSTPEPLVWVRWHPNIDTDFFDLCLENISGSTCFPLMMSDTAVPEMFMRMGTTKEDAYDYVAVGCNEIGIPGKCYFNPGASVGYLQALEMAMTGGRGYDWDASDKNEAVGSGKRRLKPTRRFEAIPIPEPDEYRDFEQFAETVEAIIRKQVERSYEHGLKILHAQMEWGRSPLTSCFFDGCIENGHDMMLGTKYNIMTCGGTMFANMVDSMAAIRAVVFEQGAATPAEVARACEVNFEGFESLRQKLLNAPKHGNDDSSLDDLIERIQIMRDGPVKEICRDIRDGTPYGNSHVVRSSAVRTGRVTPATPDGRLAGRPLAGSVAASDGAEKTGPTALVNSLCRLNPAESWQCGYNVNMRLQKEMLTDPANRNKVAALLESFFSRGGQEMQINSVSAEELRDALENPEAHRDLVVRVAGFSEYFTRLDPDIQKEVISRQEHAL
jgi:pyruvate-formate lyase